MSLKTLGAALAALVSVSAAPAPVMPDIRAIAMITCEGNSGTAFWISPTRILTAEHVSDNGNCSIMGKPVHVVRTEAGEDFVELAGAENPHFIPVSCRRPDLWERFTGWGYPYGTRLHRAYFIATTKRVRGRDDVPEADGMGVFFGQGHPGMSGGPVVDGKGRVVGMINRGGGEPPVLSSRLLRDTFACRGRR